MPQANKTTPGFQRLPVFILFAVAVAGRLLPHPPNVTPLGGMALFGAAVLSSRWLAILLPLLALYVSDLVINNTLYAQYYEGFHWGANAAVYLGFVMIIALGFWLLRNRKASSGRLLLTTIAGSLVFFLVTNYFSWYGDPLGLYADTLAGLLSCYVAALPFLFNSMLGDLFFAGVLFSAYAWYQQRYTAAA